MKTKTLRLLITCFAFAVPAAADQFVRMKASANLRVAPDSSSQVIATASRGDVFEVKSRTRDWVEVVAPSTEYRYISETLIETVSAPPPFPSSETTLRRACHEIVSAQDRAGREAQQRYPDPDFRRQITYQRTLYDRYELPLFNAYGIAPAHSAHLTGTCARNRWF